MEKKSAIREKGSTARKGEELDRIKIKTKEKCVKEEIL